MPTTRCLLNRTPVITRFAAVIDGRVGLNRNEGLPPA
jgi:hypothetical protein